MNIPALVYTTTATNQNEVDEVLHSQQLYRYDDLPELTKDLNGPVWERPILRRQFAYAGGAAQYAPHPKASRSLDHEPPPRHFITDALSTLGPSHLDQAAVVGAMLYSEIEVRVLGEVVDRSWYNEQVTAFGVTRIESVMDRLMEQDFSEEILSAWRYRNPGPSWIGATTYGPQRSLSAAQAKAQQLHAQGEARTTIGRILTTAGYRNDKGRVRWYDQNVRAASGELP